MANFKSTYSGETDFLDWYKRNYGVDYDGVSAFSRKEGMSDVDWEIGSSLYDSYKQSKQRESEYNSGVSDIERAYGNQVAIAQKNRDYSVNEATKRADDSLSQLEQFYKTTGEALDKSKRQSQQNASITLDKLKKYLPTQIKAQGLGGLGVSESTMLKAYNNYNSDMGAIESDYQQNKSTLETNYQDNKRGIESDRDSAINSANNAYNNTEASYGESKAQALSDLERAYRSDSQSAWETAKGNATGIFDRYKQKYEEAQKEAYQDAYATVSQSAETNEQNILNYIEQFRDRLSDNDFITLSQHAKQIAQSNKQAADKETARKTEEAQNSAFENARTAIASATYYTQDDFDRFLEQYRNQVTESQFNSLKLQADGKLRDNIELKKITERNQAYTIAYDFMNDLILDGNYTEAEKYLESNKDILGESYNAFKSRLSGLVSAQQEETTKKEQEKADTRILEGKEFVVYNGREYKLTSQLSQNADEIQKNNDFKTQLRSLGYTNPYDLRIPNGTTFLIKCDTFLGYKMVNVTYYNNEWYQSEDKTGTPSTSSSSSITKQTSTSVKTGNKLPQKAFQANSALVAKYGTYQNYLNDKPKTSSSNKSKHR